MCQSSVDTQTIVHVQHLFPTKMTGQPGHSNCDLDTIPTKIGQLMVDLGNSKMMNQFQREMSRYPGRQTAVDENGNFTMGKIEESNYHFPETSRKRRMPVVTEELTKRRR